MAAYILGEDGYAKIRFVKKTNNPSSQYTFDPNLAEAIRKRKLDKKSILDFELTELARGACYNDYLAKVLFEVLNYRPLPIISYLPKEQGGKRFKLFPHQTKALIFMKEREKMAGRHYGLRGGILKMDMGMGKTLTALTHALISPRPSYDEKHGGDGFPTLIIASKTVMIEWKTNGIERFFDRRVKVLYLHRDYIGNGIETVTRAQVVKYDFVITTYDMCSSVCRKRAYHEETYELGDSHTLMKDKIVSVHCRNRNQADKPNITGPSIIYTTPWERVICDESQRFANPDTQTYRHIMAVYGRYKWCLTGTPIRNYTTDIWSQLRFCGYNGVERKQVWIRSGFQTMKTHNLTDAILSMDYQGAHIKMPEKNEYDIYVELEGKEKECYERVLKRTRDAYDLMMNGLCDYACILALFTRLRQTAIAPYLLTAESKREKRLTKVQQNDRNAMAMLKDIYKGKLSSWVYDKSGKAGIYSKKITEIIHVLRKIPPGEKVLIFSMFTSVLDLVAEACQKRVSELKFVQIDGDTKGTSRQTLLRRFREDKTIQGLFMTYKVGSEGLNLTEATHVICVEPWWTNAVHNQAKARCYRTGQKYDVKVHNIYVKDSIEDKVVQICKEKDEMANIMLDGTGQRLKSTGLDKYTLGRILGIHD